VELIGLSAIFAVFVGLVVLMSTREVVLALIFAGIAFIVSLVGLAMLSLAVRPDKDEKLDLLAQDADEQERKGPSGH
jgi:amino acid permease